MASWLRSHKSQSDADYAQVSLAYLPPTPQQARITLTAMAILLVGLLVSIPFAGKPAVRVAGFIPALDAIIFVTDAITASLFFAHFAITRSKGLCALGCGYLFSAVIVVIHGLTFPGVITDTGNLLGGTHTNFRIYLLWHLGLPLALMAYLSLRDKSTAKPAARGPTEIPAICAAVVAFSLLSCVACLALVPAVSPVDGRWLTGVTMLICAAALSILWLTQRTALDRWLMVVVFAMIVELAITALIGGLGPRSASWGFYIGRIFSLVTSTVVLVVLLGETTRVYGGAARGTMLANLVGASQALSGEIELNKLIERIITTAANQTGADYGVLVLPTGDGFEVHSTLRVNDGMIEVVMRREPISGRLCPETIIHQVMRSDQSVMIDAASDQGATKFAEDEYLKLGPPRSIICVPLKRHGVLGGILYLENSQRAGAFNTERVAQLELLASQAAISLENSALYESLREREERVRRLIEANIIGIFTWNLDGQIIDANEAFLRIVGYGSGDVASGQMRWKDLMPGEWDPDNDSILKNMLATGATPPFRTHYTRKDGSAVPVLIGAAQFGGTPIEGVAFVVDMTDQSKAEEKAQERERQYREVQLELAHANRLATMGQLSASIAHELNQPLQGIITNSQVLSRLLDRAEPKLDDAKNVLSRLTRDGTRAGDVVSRIRTLVKKAPAQREQLNVNEAIVDVVALLHAEITRSGASIQTRLEPDLPPAQGDRVQLQQVVLNLAMNAIDAVRTTPNDRRQILISSQRLVDGALQVSVADTGHGIEGDKIARIFDAFYTTKPQGLGMGLSICRSIVEAHGGKLWATSEGSGGSVFYFSIPIEIDSRLAP